MASKNPYESVTFGNSLLLRVDGAIGAMSLSPNGRDAVLAGRRGLFIIDLDEPFTTPRWLHHITSWEVADVQWSPHHFAKPSWCISTSNQKALLWDLSRPSDSAIQNVLHGHTRAITDINFHPHDPEILATCSIDTFILSWDMRTPRKAVQNWAEWRAGATQVKWNHKNPYEIASSHDHSFYIWDTRKGAMPVLKIDDAHNGKINGIDFSNGLSSIITSSNDSKIKYWDLTKINSESSITSFDTKMDISPAIIINADFPVARARCVPFGSEQSCGVMPLRGGQDAIHILNLNSALQDYVTTGETQVLEFDPIYSFKGHGGPMKDFLWRKRHGSYEGVTSPNNWTDYQLVTWSSLDYDLKLWPHDDELYKKVNYHPLYQEVLDQLPGTRDSPDSTTTTSEVNNYNTYCTEPPITLSNILYKQKGDLLSSMAMFQIAKKNKNLPVLPAQLNHLAWISGVRMGRNDNQTEKLNDDTNPSNLGEEVSIVAHTFPKIRFEKISVSTGELILSMRGPMPTTLQNDEGEEVTKETNEETETSTDSLDKRDDESQAETDTIQATQDDKDDQKLVFIRIAIHFPKNYPYLDDVPSNSNSTKKFLRNNFIRFEIEETHELTSQVREEMLNNLKEISFFFSNKHQRFCLEALLRYLMGDKINLDDSLLSDAPLDEENEIEVGNEGWADDLINQQPDEFESPAASDSDDDDYEDQFSDFMPALNDEEMINSTGSLSTDGVEDKEAQPTKSEDNVASNKFFDSTPIPKGCGAVWCPNGQLVCFFIPKENEEEDSKALQKFSIFKFADGGAHDDEYVGSDSNDSGSSESDAGEDNDDDNSSSASSDSFTNEWEDIEEDDFTARFRVPGLFKTSVGLGNRYISRTGPGKSNTGTGSNYKSSVPGATLVDISTRKKRAKSSKRSKNVVQIFDFRHLIPDKQELALEYRILGDSPENLARYNSQVAFKYGLTDIGDAWKILEMVLLKDIEINDIHPVYYSQALIQNPNSTVAKNVEAMNHLIYTNEMTKKMFSNKTYRFYWGSHPFGYSWLIKEMMDYFERMGNLQMLVMMSCILFENTKNVASSPQNIINIPIHTPYETKPQPPSMIQLRRFNESFNSFHESLSSDASDIKTQTPRNSSIHYAKSLTSNPDDTLRDDSPERQFSSLSLGQASMRKNFPLSPSLQTHDIRRQSSEPRRRKGVISPFQPLSRKNIKRGVVPPPPQVLVTFENLDTLDLFDDIYTQPLLSSKDDNKIKLYREQYAEMLYNWGLPTNRIKILKFNYPNSDLDGRYVEHICSFGFRKQARIEQRASDHYVNQISTVKTSQKNPWVVNLANELKYCNLCNLLVSKRLVLCTNCEHVLHSHCALEWWEDNEEECPSGCGCKCLDYRI